MSWFRKKKEIFKMIEIQLTGPICSCKTQDLVWGLYADDGNKYGLKIICKLCKTSLDVPDEKVLATFKFDRAYPEDRAQLAIMDGGRVLPFVRPTDENQEPKAGA